MTNNILDDKLIKENTAVELIIGSNSRYEVLKLIGLTNILLVSSKRTIKVIQNDKKFDSIFQVSASVDYFYVKDYPELSLLEVDINSLKLENYEYILAIGGGSVIDTAKIIRTLDLKKTKKNAISNLLNLNNLEKPNKMSKLVALPTTAGTGSEVTPYATLWDSKNKKKHSVTADWLTPDISIVDPDFLESLPKDIAINTGLDAINQAFDSIWNKSARDETLKIGINAIQNGINVLPHIEKRGFNHSDRNIMSRVSLQAGICIAKTKTSICHSISYPITSYFNVPHGLACVFTMNAVIKMIYYKNKDKAQYRINKISTLWNSNQDILDTIDDFAKRMQIAKKIKHYIPSIKDLLDIKDQMYTPNRMDNFILPINSSDIEDILISSWNDE